MSDVADRRRNVTALGVDVGGTTTKAGLVTSEGTLLARSERPTDPTAGTKGIIAVVEDLLARGAGDGSGPIVGIGIGAAGFIDASQGSVTFSPNLEYDDPHIAAAVRTRVDLPVVVDNDANAAAWGERAYGSASGCNDLAMLTLGTGVGSGFIVDGRLMRGSTGAGAEFGHLVVHPDGPPCPCGLRGCLEQFVSGNGIERAAREAVAASPASTILAFAGTPQEITAKHVSQAAREYDEIAREVLRSAGRMLGIGLSNIVNVFDPEVIVLGGSVVGAGEPFLGPARDTFNGMLLAQRRRPVRLDVTSLGNDVGILGAAALAFEMAEEGGTGR